MKSSAFNINAKTLNSDNKSERLQILKRAILPTNDNVDPGPNNDISNGKAGPALLSAVVVNMPFS